MSSEYPTMSVLMYLDEEIRVWDDRGIVMTFIAHHKDTDLPVQNESK